MCYHDHKYQMSTSFLVKWKTGIQQSETVQMEIGRTKKYTGKQNCPKREFYKITKSKKLKWNWSAAGTLKGERNVKNERYCIWLICDQISFLEVLCLWCFLVPCVNTCSIMLIMLTVFPIEWLFFHRLFPLISSHLIFVIFEIHNVMCFFLSLVSNSKAQLYGILNAVHVKEWTWALHRNDMMKNTTSTMTTKRRADNDSDHFVIQNCIK